MGSRNRIGILCFGLLWLGLVLCLGLLQLQAQQTEEKSNFLDDPTLPIRKVYLSTEKWIQERDKLKEGIWVRLPRKDLDQLLQQIKQQNQAKDSRAKLVESVYRCKFQQQGTDRFHLVGTAEWKIAHRGSKAALLGLESFQLPIQQARWSDGQVALLGMLDPRTSNIFLYVDPNPERSLILDWSARGLAEPGQIRFDLSIPAAPIAFLEMELPVDWIPNLGQKEGNVRDSNPPEEKRQTWKIPCGGLSRLEILLRRQTTPPHLAPLARTRITSEQRVSLNQVRCKFDVDLEILRTGTRELLFDLDSSLQPLDVSVNNLQSWQLIPQSPTKQQLLIRLREPIQAGKVEITAVAPLWLEANRFWTSPAIDLVGAIRKGEIIDVRVAPDLLILDWQPQSYRTLSAETTNDGSIALRLQPNLLGDGEKLLRPKARFQGLTGLFEIEQHSQWNLETDQSSFSSSIQLQGTRGSLSIVSFRFPSGWEVDQVDGAMPTMVPQWTVRNTILQLEFPKPIGPTVPVTFQVRLRPTSNDFNQPLALPDLEPIGSLNRHGTFAIRVRPAYEAQLHVPRPFSEIQGPPAPSDFPGTQWVFPFQGVAPTGELLLRPRLARLNVEAEISILSQPEGLHFISRFQLQPRSGILPSVLVQFSAPIQPSEWRTLQGNNRVLDAQEVPMEQLQTVLANIGQPLAGGAFPWSYAYASQGNWYRLSFAKPLEEPITLETTYQPKTSAAVLPLPFVHGAETFNGLVLPYGSIPDPERDTNLEKISSATERLRYQYRKPVTWKIPLAPRPGNRASAKIDQAQLWTMVLPHGEPEYQFSFRIQDWPHSQLPVQLPGNAQLQEIRIDGKTLLPAQIQLEDEATILVPIPKDSQSHQVEILYVWSQRSHWAWRWIPAIEPQLPVSIDTIHRVWKLDFPWFPFDTNPLQPTQRIPEQRWFSLPQPLKWLVNRLLQTEAGGEARSGNGLWVSTTGQPILLVQQDRIGLLGIVGFFAVLLVAACRKGGSPRRHVVGLLALLVVCGLAGRLLPASVQDLVRGPLLAGLLVGAWMIWNCPPPHPKEKTVLIRNRPVLKSLFLFLFLFLGTSGWAATEAIHIYFVLDKGEAESIFITPEGLQRLKEAGDSKPITNPLVLLDATYDGTSRDNLAEFRATFLLHHFAEGTSTLNLPLSGVRLKQVLLDGAPTLVQSTSADRFLMDIKGSGPHKLECTFTTTVTGTSTDRDIRFTIPETVRTHLDFSAPKEILQQLQVINWRGEQRLTQTDTEEGIHAELGKTRSVHITWKQAGSGTTTPQIRVNEFHFWEIDSASASLFTHLDYRLQQGTVDTFVLFVPKDLEIGKLQFRSESPFSITPPSWIRDWRLEATNAPANYQKLIVRLQSPTTGRCSLQMELIPRQPLSQTPTLQVPFIQDIADVQSVIGLRLNGWEFVGEVEDRNCIDIPPDTFRREIGKTTTLLPTSVPTRAFRRKKAEPVVLKPTLQPPASNVSYSQNVVGSIGWKQFDLQVTMERSSEETKFQRLEWYVPSSIQIQEVRGDNLLFWNRLPGRLLIWLKEPVKNASCTWIGSIPLSGDPTGPRQVNLPEIRPIDRKAIATNVRILAMPDRHIQVEKANLQIMIEQDTGHSIRFETDQADQEVLLRIVPAPRFSGSVKSEIRVGKEHPKMGTFEPPSPTTTAEVPSTSAPSQRYLWIPLLAVLLLAGSWSLLSYWLPHKTRPEQFGILSLLGLAGMGFPDGFPLLSLGAMAVLWRTGILLRQSLIWLTRQIPV